MSTPDSTGGEDSGRQLRTRIGEYIFRWWPLLLAVVLVVSGVGVLQARKMDVRYESTGTISVGSSALLVSLGTAGNVNATGQTVAQRTANAINELLASDPFATSVATAAGLPTAGTASAAALDTVRQDLSVQARGDTLLGVTATSSDPVFAQKLASGALTTYTTYYSQNVVASQSSNSSAAVTFYTARLAEYQTQATAAEQALNDYVAQHPAPAIGVRPDDVTLRIQRLNDTLTTALNQLNAVQLKIDDAQLQTQQEKDSIADLYQVVEVPTVPSAPVSTKTKKALEMGIFVALGLLIAAALVVVMSLLDRRVRSSMDINRISGMSVIAVVPKRRRRRRRGAEMAQLGPMERDS